MTPQQIAALPPGPWTDGNGVIRDGNGAFIASSFYNRNSDIAHDEQSKAVAQLLIEARDILAENARLREALEAARKWIVDHHNPTKESVEAFDAINKAIFEPALAARGM